VDVLCSHGGGQTVDLFFSHGGGQTVELWNCSLFMVLDRLYSCGPVL